MDAILLDCLMPTCDEPKNTEGSVFCCRHHREWVALAENQTIDQFMLSAVRWDYCAARAEVARLSQENAHLLHQNNVALDALDFAGEKLAKAQQELMPDIAYPSGPEFYVSTF